MAKNGFRTIYEVVGKNMTGPMFAGVKRGFLGLKKHSKSATDRLRDTGTAMQKYFLARDIGAGFLRLGKGIVGMFAGATDAAGKFEYGIASVGAVTKATTGELKSLEKAAIQAGIKTQFSPQEAVAGLQSLATAGQTAAQATATLVPVLDLAAGSMGQLGVEGAAEAVVGTLNSYSMAADQAAGVTDKLLRITQLTNFQTRDFSIGLSKAAAMGANFDQSLTDVLVGMGQLRNRNIDASTSATSLREAFRRLGSDAGAQQAVQKHGIKIFDESTNKMRSTLDIIQELNAATTDLGVKEKKALMTKVLGTRGQLAWNAVVGASVTVQENGTEVVLKGADAIAHLRNEIDNATGTAEEFRKKLLDTFEGQKTLLRGTMETLSVVTGKAFAGIFAPAVLFITNALNKLIVIIDALPPSAKKMAAAVTTATGVIIGLTGALVMAQAVMKMFGIRLRDIGFMLVKTLLFMGPLVVLIGALGIGIFGIARHFNSATEAGNDFVGIVDKIKVGFMGLIDLISSGGLSAATIKELDRIDSQGIRTFLDTADTWIKNMKSFFGGVIDGFDSGLARLEGPWNKIKRTIGEVFGIWLDGTNSGEKGLALWEERGMGFGKILSGTSVVLLEMVDKIIKGVGSIGEAFDGFTFEGFLEGLRVMADIITGIGSTVKWIVNAFDSFGTMLGESAGSIVTLFQGVGELFDIGSKSRSAKDIGQLSSHAFAKIGSSFTGEFSERGVQQKRQTEKLSKVRSLTDRAGEITEWMNTPPEWWADSSMPSFANSSPAMKSEFVEELKEIRKELIKQGAKIKPVNIEIDGQKVMSVLGRRGEDRQESSMDGASDMFVGG